MDGQQRDQRFAVWIPAIATFLLLVVLIDKRAVTTFGEKMQLLTIFGARKELILKK
ncbi:hypothetical protein JG687_00011431 [Phytophthora cactorum]|uniref:Uncharacterized protein n=1 Tax=Phytophthora cactorum TaxID=29920 RepID=A0A8T1U4L3_9STRA|nr:hypothetical protein JG687_00011431 [Phytophthora cactorum]